MSAYLILATDTTYAKLEAKVDEHFAETSKFFLRDGAWLVDYDGTTQLLSEKLGIRAGDTEPGVVFLIANYSGRAAPDIWEWLSKRVLARAG